MRGRANYTTSHWWGNIQIEWDDDGSLLITSKTLGVTSRWVKDERRSTPY